MSPSFKQETRWLDREIHAIHAARSKEAWESKETICLPNIPSENLCFSLWSLLENVNLALLCKSGVISGPQKRVLDCSIYHPETLLNSAVWQGDRVRALAPRLYEARSAPSWVAIGTTYSRLAYSPLTCPSIPKSQYRFAMICLRCVLPNYFNSSTRQHSGSLEEKGSKM